MLTHLALIGATEQGKTQTLNRIISRLQRISRKNIIKFDPHEEQSKRGNHWVTPDFETFSKWFWGSENCVAVVEEAADVSDDKEFKKDFSKMLRRGRHRGHCMILLTQNYYDLPKNVRNQVNDWYFFWGRQDSSVYAQIHPLLRFVPQLKPLHYLHLNHEYEVEAGYITFS